MAPYPNPIYQEHSSHFNENPKMQNWVDQVGEEESTKDIQKDPSKKAQNGVWKKIRELP